MKTKQQSSYHVEPVWEIYDRHGGYLGHVRRVNISGGMFYKPERPDGERVVPTLGTTGPGWFDKDSAARALVLSYNVSP